MAEVLSAAHLPDGQLDFPTSSLRRSSTSYTSFFAESPTSTRFKSSKKSNRSQTDLRSISSGVAPTKLPRSGSFSRLPPLETRFKDEDEDTNSLPAYPTRLHLEVDKSRRSGPATSRTMPAPAEDAISPIPSTPDALLTAGDDTAIQPKPTRHVDYLSHDWKEEDIWSSWRHIVSQRRVYGQRSRLENASWRTWAKSQFKLKTVSPETLNWLKDCDVTWLYGPLQPASTEANSQHASEPASRLSKSNSFLHKKPILKKRSMSEVMLQESISASSLVKQAAAAVQAQQANGMMIPYHRRGGILLGRTVSDYGTSSVSSQTISRDPIDSFSSRSTSGLQTPDHSERKHIRFDDKVEQCIAVEVKDGDDDDEMDSWATRDDDDSSDDGVVMMKKSRKRRPLPRTNSKSSSAGESKTIAKLPSTTLKYRTDSPDVDDQPSHHSLGFYRSSGLSPSPSQETLRPSNPATNFLLADDEHEDEEAWEPPVASEGLHDTSTSSPGYVAGPGRLDANPGASAGGLRRTASGIIMPLEEVDEDQESVAPGLIGRVVDTVNTARDIAHVIWNVGWRG